VTSEGAIAGPALFHFQPLGSFRAAFLLGRYRGAGCQRGEH
jgi:hypothetical protein